MIKIQIPLYRIMKSFDENLSKHCKHVSYWSELLAFSCGLPKNSVEQIKIAGLVHDIGKIGISKSILNKRGVLNNNERKQVEKHPIIGNSIVSSIPFVSIEILKGVLHHHERWDGLGYPRKLEGAEIPIAGRILGIADVFSAMIMDRPYRKALSINQAIDELLKGSGNQFDPELVEFFIPLVYERKKNMAEGL